VKTRVQKWGNSLGVRIPKPFALELGLEDDETVEISLRQRRLIIQPAAQSLDELLARVTRKNVHREVDFGPAQGREAW
jgi:antitoxin MazE